MNEELAKRLWITRYFMVLGIVVLHLPPYQPLTETGTSIVELFKAFLSHGVFRATVPVLTVISGFLLFSSSLAQQPIKLLFKKSQAILLPLIIWNIPVVIGIFLLQHYQLSSHNFSAQLVPFQPMNWVNATTGLFGLPANYPLNFLRDLFILSLLSPIFLILLKKAPYLGLCLILIIYYYNLEASLILRNSMIVSFYIGGLASSQRWNITMLDRHAISLTLVFLFFSAAIVIFKIENRELFRLISPFLIWPAMSLLVNTRIGHFLYTHSSSSFFTFLIHGPILLVTWLIFQHLPLELPYIIYYISAPIITMFLSIYLCKYFKLWLPKLAKISLGGR